MDIFFKLLPTKNKCHTRGDCQSNLKDVFFEFSEADGWKKSLNKIIQNSMTYEMNIPKNSPSNILFIGSLFSKLIFTGYFLFKNHQTSSISDPKWEDLISDRTLNRNLIYKLKLIPTKLELSEIQNPGLFINKFFYHKSLKKWIKHLNILMEFSISNDSLRNGYDEYLVDDVHMFEGLLEACYLIYVRDFQQKEMNNEDHQD